MANPRQVRPLSRADVRELDRRAIEEYGLPGLVLMENAGRGCVDALLALGCAGPVAIVCGRGNNAGDGFVIARHLERRGIDVRVVLLAPAESLRGDAAANYVVLQRSGTPIYDLSGSYSEQAFDEQLRGCEWIIDALLGTGASGAPRPPMDAAIRRMNAASARKLAVDLPSGLECDTGAAAEPAFRADHTCTFVATKLGFTNPAATAYLGQVHIVDIGVPRRLLSEIAGFTFSLPPRSS